MSLYHSSKKLSLDKGFWVQIMKTLHSRVEMLDKSNSPAHPWRDARPVLGGIVNDALQDVLDRTDADELFRAPYTHYFNAPRVSEDGITRALDILELCISMKHLDACGVLFQKLLVLPSQAELERRFASFFTPFMPKIKALLQRHKLRADAPPFKSFFKTLINIYSDHLVGRQPTNATAAKWEPKKIGCGCGDCAELGKFTLSPDKQSVEFRLVTKRRDHLLRQIEASNHRDGAIYSAQVIRSGSPYGLVVTKNRNFTHGGIWATKRAKLEAFKKSIGNEALLTSITSEDPGEAFPTLTPTDAGPSRSESKSTTIAGSSKAQGKRKRSKAVVDLTGDD